MKKIFYIFLAAMGLSLASCTFKDDSVFDKNSAQRMKETIEKANKVLTSSASGWVMQVYPEETRAYGAFNLLMHFTNDGKVDVASEYSGYEVATSFYKIDMSAGAVLSFDSYNEIFHYLSDPSINDGGGHGYGFEGDYDYLIISVSDKEIVLKGKKSGNYAYLKALPTGVEWDEYLDSLDEAYEVVLGFSKRELHIADKVYPVSVNNHTFIVDVDMDGFTQSFNLPFAVNPEGLVLYEPFELQGKKMQEFKIDEDNLVDVNDATIYFAPYIAPLNEAFATGDWFITKANMSGEMATNIQTFVDMVKASEGETVVYLAMCNGGHIMAKYTTWGLFMYVDAGYSALWGFTATPDPEDPAKVSLIYNKTQQGDANYYQSYCGSTHLSAFGMAAAHTFEITADNPKAPKELTLTEVGKPENHIKFVSNMVQY